MGLRLVNGYGLTECAPGLRTRPDRDAAPECIGWPEAGVETRVVGIDGIDAAAGELWLRSATMMMGYYGYPAQSAEALRPGGWLATGDLARVLEDGSMGRKRPDGNEEVVAFVQFRAGQHLSSQEIQHQLRASLAAYKCPSRVVILDALPTGPTGKIWKARLAQMAAQP